MANVLNDFDTAQGWLKEITGKVNDVRPDGVKLTKMIGFDSSKKLGQKYVEPVWLSEEQGFTYDAGTTGGGFDLNDAEAAVSRELELSGAEIVLKSQVGFKQFQAAVGGGKESFGNFYRALLANMASSFKKRVEVTTFYGGRAIGQAASFSGSSTSRVVTLNTRKYAPGIWAGAKNAKVDCYNGSNKLNTRADVKVTAHAPGAAPTITITGNADDMTDINAAGADCVFYYKGAYGQEMTGLITIANNTSASYANISATDYDLWRGNPIDCEDSDLTWDRIQEGVVQAVGRGLDEPIVLYVPLPAWSSLNSDLSALRQFDSSYRKEKNEIGQESIVYHTLCGTVRVEPSIYVQYGDAVALPEAEEYAARVGSTDITFQIPGTNDEYFMVVPGKHAIEYRAASDQALLVRAPSKCIHWYDIVSSS